MSRNSRTILVMATGAIAICAAAVFVAWLCDQWPGATGAYYAELTSLTAVGVVGALATGSYLKRRRSA